MNLTRLPGVFAVTAAIALAGSPKRITQTEAMAAAVSRVQPEYPELAKKLKITGAVELELLIAENGSVETATPVSGNPVLTKPAADALKRWKFKPFQENGAAVKAQVVLKVGFGN